jgi:hypothetical protein
MPSICAKATPVDKRVSLREALAPFIEEENTVFRCPGDILLDDPPWERFYDREKLSYEYDPARRLVNFDSTTQTYMRRSRQEVAGREREGKLSLVILAVDYEAFHGPKGEDGSRCVVFADGHAEAP